MDEQKKTTAQWAKVFGELLKQVDPGYERNRNYTGRLIEYTRPLDNGLYASQNCIAKQGSYSHCLAVLFTRRRLSPRLLSPFVAGSRFDHNEVIQSQYYREFGRGRRDGLHSTHSWRTRAEELVVQACTTAEKELLPHYLQQLAKGSASLLRVFQAGFSFANRSDEEIQERDSQLSPEVRQRYANVTALDIAAWPVGLQDPLDVAETAVVLAYLDDFRLLREDSARLLEIVRAL